MLYISHSENLKKLQILLIIYFRCGIVLPTLANRIQVIRCSWIPCVIQIICYVSISDAPETWIAKEFRIFTELTMLNNHLQSIAKENRNQLLDFPETDPAQCISYHPGIETRSKQYRVDVLHPETWLTYSRFTQRIQPSISLLPYEMQAHLSYVTAPIFNSTANVNKLPLIMNIQSHAWHASQPCIPTSYDPWVFHFAPFQAYILPSWMCWICGCQHTQSVHLSDTKLLGTGAAHPARPQQTIKSMLDWYV